VGVLIFSFDDFGRGKLLFILIKRGILIFLSSQPQKYIGNLLFLPIFADGLLQVENEVLDPFEDSGVEFQFHFLAIDDGCKHSLVFFEQISLGCLFDPGLVDHCGDLLLKFPLLGELFIVLGSQISNSLHQQMVCFDDLFSNVELQSGNQLGTSSLDVVFDPHLLGLGHGLVEEQGSRTEVLELFRRYTKLVSFLPFTVNVVSGLHSESVLLYELEQHRNVVDLQITLENCLLVRKLLLLLLCPSGQLKLAFISDLDIGEFVLNSTLHPFLPNSGGNGLVSEHLCL
jgi:hypothetical protein